MTFRERTTFTERRFRASVTSRATATRADKAGEVPSKVAPSLRSGYFRQTGEGVGKKARAARSSSKDARLSSFSQLGEGGWRDTRLQSFRSTVLGYWRKEGRHDLPWRKTHDPYKILVSEIMLQQTQVERVIPKYNAFIKRFPTARALAKAPLRDVLALWSGLGYNRRAKYLHDAVKIVVSEYKGDFVSALSGKLPGVGPYTRAAVSAFAFNEPGVVIETNIRTVFMHHFLPKKKKVSDEALAPLIEQAMRGQDVREWYSALMDYGSYLKRQGISHNARSKHYVKQSKFDGSLRQVRGAILRARIEGKDMRSVEKRFPTQFQEALRSLKRDGLI